MGMGGLGGPAGDRRRRVVAGVVVLFLVLGVASVLLAYV